MSGESAFIQSLLDHRLVDEASLRGLRLSVGPEEYALASRLYETAELLSDRELISKLYGSSLGKAHVPLDRTLFQAGALEKLLPEMARRLQCIPVYFLGEVLTVAMTHPDDPVAVQKLERMTGCQVSSVFAFPEEIQNSIDIQYGGVAELEKLSGNISSALPDIRVDSQQLANLASSQEVVELVRGLMLYCLKNRASDIHIQPTSKTLEVRFRIDGRLQTLLSLDKSLNAPVIAHLKIKANCDMTERRQPQDGRVSLEMKGRHYDFRLSTVPTVFGEKAVIRAIGSAEQAVKTLEQLGFTRRNRQLLESVIHQPNGIFFVTGPTGSGKTTTLYSVLAMLQDPHVNIVTVEDPVELRMDGISQIQTNAAVGLDFAKALRAVLRQDPEIVLIGEIRDMETARIATQAALTGHMVMATLHTNSSLQAVTRLIEIGVDPFLVAPTVLGSMGQRLMRRVCEHCREAYEPEPEILDALFYNRDGAPVQFYRAKGCPDCGNTGYSGRVAIHELFVPTNIIRSMIADRASIIDIEREAVRRGFRSMRYDALLKALQGQTTLEEVFRVTGGLPVS